MLVLTGRQRLFDAFLLNSGQEARIEVKLNSRKMFEFGLCLPGTVTGENGVKELQANMFDAQKCGSGKAIRIDPPTETGMKVHLVTVDEREHRLEMTRVKLYRESERISTSTWISSIIPGENGEKSEKSQLSSFLFLRCHVKIRWCSHLSARLLNLIKYFCFHKNTTEIRQ